MQAKATGICITPHCGVQVWKDITERICQGLQELEQISPPNANQLKEKNVSQGSIEADLKKRDPVLPER